MEGEREGGREGGGREGGGKVKYNSIYQPPISLTPTLQDITSRAMTMHPISPTHHIYDPT